MIRERLEELSLEELFLVATNNGIDPEPDIDREELIEQTADAINENREERDNGSSNSVRIERKKFSVINEDESPLTFRSLEDFELPRQYDRTRIVLMLRDPSWAYTYWDLSNAKRRTYERSERFDGLSLRVLELDSDSDEELRIRDSFEIPVQLADRSWYIYLPRQDESYRIQLIGRNHHRRELLALSNRVYVPRSGLASNFHELDTRRQQILQMCGLDFLQVKLGIDMQHPTLPEA